MNIYITLDYELFLNDITGDVDHCLITPTKELLKVLDKHQIKATFFVDMAYIYRLNELREQYTSLQEDFDKVVWQVKELAGNGHRIGLHIHPQWFYSTYDGEKWNVDFDHYKLSDMPAHEAIKKFSLCKNMLVDISECEVTAFRAGGFSIQTFGQFSETMRNNAINKDSSVTYKGRCLSNLHYYDYSSLESPEVYKFKEDILKPENDGFITEYPISTAKTSFLNYCLLRYKYHKMLNNDNWGNGGDYPANRRANFIHSLVNKMRLTVGIGASIDYQSFFHLRNVYKQYNNRGYHSLVILGHPKNLSRASLDYLESFINDTKMFNSYNTI